MKDVLLLHGYNVTSTKTYGVLPQRLKSLGYKVKNVYLSKYVTLDDDLTLADIVRGFQAALVDVYGPKFESQEFACITHSTGGLVARAWIDTYYGAKMKALPMTHLIMLAPPTNGSRLANLGKSKLSRLRSILGVEPGLRILDDLELGSAFQWDLNSSWMRKKLHHADGFYPFVITGQWVDKKMWDVLAPATYERGSDGVVRAAAANLNMQKFTIHSNGAKPLHEVMQAVAFYVAPKTAHTGDDFGIMMGVPAKGGHAVLSAIDAALQVKDRKSYVALETDFALKTREVQNNELFYDGSPLNRYCQLVFRITDDSGNNLTDYAIELIDGDRRGDKLPTGFAGHHHRNEARPERFIFYLNWDLLAKVPGGKLGFRVNAATGTTLVEYPVFEFLGSVSDVSMFLKPNQTTFVDVVLKRRLNKNVFRLTKNLSYQKIDGKAGEEWIG